MGTSIRNEDKNENIQMLLISFSNQLMYFNSVKLHEGDCKLFWKARKFFCTIGKNGEVNVITVNL